MDYLVAVFGLNNHYLIMVKLKFHN